MIDWSKIARWLGTDTGIAWTLGIIFTTTMKLVYDFLKRKQPSIVVCKELDKFSLIRISKKVKDNIILKYKNSEIKNLSQVEIELYNSGDETIENLEIQVCFENETKVLDVVTSGTADISNKKSTANNIVNFELSYLNSYRNHQSKIRINIVCDGRIDDFSISGGGSGWSLRHKKLPTLQQAKLRFMLVVAFLFIEIVFFYFLNKFLKINSSTFLFDLPSIFFSLVFMLTYIGGFIWALPYKSKRMLEVYDLLNMSIGKSHKS